MELSENVLGPKVFVSAETFGELAGVVGEFAAMADVKHVTVTFLAGDFSLAEAEYHVTQLRERHPNLRMSVGLTSTSDLPDPHQWVFPGDRRGRGLVA